MSESDDTDVLLLIPPDIFRVPSSTDSDNSSADPDGSLRRHRTGVISELVGHMQSLESRVSAIESRDNSLDVSNTLNNSLEDLQPTLRGASECRQTCQTLPRVSRFTVSQGLHGGSPVKPRNCLSVPSTPSGYSSQKHANCPRNDARFDCRLATAATSSPTNTNNSAWAAKHNALTSYSDSFVAPSASCGTGLSHATAVSTMQDSARSLLRVNDRTASTSNLYYRPRSLPRSSLSTTDLSAGLTADQQPARSRIVQEMELSEVDELLQEMEATELELSKRISSVGGCQFRKSDPLQAQSMDSTSNQEIRTQQKSEAGRDNQRITSNNRKLDFQSCAKEYQLTDAALSQKRTNDASFPDVSLPYSDSFHLNDTDKMISEFRTWEQGVQPSAKSNGHTRENISGIRNIDLYLSNMSTASITAEVRAKESVPDQSTSLGNASNVTRVQSSLLAGSADSVSRTGEKVRFPNTMTLTTGAQEPLDLCKTLQPSGNSRDDQEKSEFGKSVAHIGTNTDLQSTRYP